MWKESFLVRTFNEVIKAQLQVTGVFTRAKAINKDRCSKSHPTKTANIISYDDTELAVVLSPFKSSNGGLFCIAETAAGRHRSFLQLSRFFASSGGKACKIWSFGA